jgi:hypothetical protein
VDAAKGAVTRKERVVLWAASLLLALAVFKHLHNSRPPYFSRPRTIVDHTVFGPLPDILTLLQRAKRVIPRGSRVTCFRPANGRAHDEPLTYLTTSGILGDLVTLPAPSAGDDVPKDQLAEYVIAVELPFTHPAYKEIAAFPEGRVYRVDR